MSEGVRRELTVAVRTWLADAAAVPLASIIPAQDRGPRPALPYFTIQVTSVRVVGVPGDVRKLADYDGTPVSQNRARHEAGVLISGYGAGCLEALEVAERAAWDRELAERTAVVVVPNGGVRDLTALVDTAFESRGALDLTVGFVTESGEVEYDYAETTEVAATVEEV